MISIVLRRSKRNPGRPCVRVNFGEGKSVVRVYVWLDTISVFKTAGDWPRKKMKLALDNIELNQENLLEEWSKMFGGTTPIR